MPAASLVALIEQIAKRRGPVQVYIRRDGLSLKMTRRGAPG